MNVYNYMYYREMLSVFSVRNLKVPSRGFCRVFQIEF